MRELSLELKRELESLELSYTQDPSRPLLVSTLVLGSHAYGLNDEESDVDTCALVLPRKELLVQGVVLKNKHLVSEKEDTRQFDLRTLFKTLQSPNLESLQLLATPYYKDRFELESLEWGRENLKRLLKSQLTPMTMSSLATAKATWEKRPHHSFYLLFLLLALNEEKTYETSNEEFMNLFRKGKSLTDKLDLMELKRNPELSSKYETYFLELVKQGEEVASNLLKTGSSKETKRKKREEYENMAMELGGAMANDVGKLLF